MSYPETYTDITMQRITIEDDLLSEIDTAAEDAGLPESFRDYP